MESVEWRDGYPRRQGYYEVLIDGHNEDIARYFHCEVSGRDEWIARDGSYMRGHRIQWFGDPMRTP